jgi:hypothetical protein
VELRFVEEEIAVRTRSVAATSSCNEVVGFWTTLT